MRCNHPPHPRPNLLFMAQDLTYICTDSISASLITAAEQETGPQSPDAAYTHVLWMSGWLGSWRTACLRRASQIRPHAFGSHRTPARRRHADVEWRNSSFASEETESRQPHICEPIWLRDWCVLSLAMWQHTACCGPQELLLDLK